MIGPFLRLLADANLELWPEQVADVLWLALKIERSVVTSPSVLPEANLKTQHVVSDSGDPHEDSSIKPSLAESVPLNQPPSKPGELYASLIRRQRTSGDVRVVPIGVRGADALPGKAGINRALRPLKRKVLSRRNLVINEDATVKCIASGGVQLPVLEPARERWFDICLLLDEGASMHVWREAEEELERLLVAHGSFRDVRTWAFEADDGRLKLYGELGLDNPVRRLRSPRELIAMSGRRLVLVMSDCISDGWRSGECTKMLRALGRKMPVALIQVLPQRLWRSTGLDLEVTVLQSFTPGAANSTLKFKAPSDVDTNAAKDAFPLPVVNLEGWSIAPWARLVSNSGNAFADGVLLSAQPIPSDPDSELDRNKVENGTTLLKRFRATASPLAYRLAAYLSSAPLVLPVMRMVQQTMLPQSRQVHLAEVLLGGILRQQEVPNGARDPDSVEYEFLYDIRDVLQANVPEANKRNVIYAVSRFLEKTFGIRPNIRALLGDPTGRSREFANILGKFAEVTLPTFRNSGEMASDAPQHPAKANAIASSTNVERASMIGSAYKRKAAIFANRIVAGDIAPATVKEFNNAVNASIAAYQTAAGEFASGNFEPYPALNWLALKSLSGRFTAGVDTCRKCAKIANEKFARTPDFWCAVMAPEAALIESLCDGSLGGAAAELRLDQIARGYSDALATIQVAPKELDSMVQQLLLLALLFEAGKKLGMAQRLRRLAERLLPGSSAADETSRPAKLADKPAPSARRHKARRKP